MLVERLLVCWTFLQTRFTYMLNFALKQEPDANLYKPALEAIKDSIKTSTSSMTAVPKPLKFLRPHYEALTKRYESWPPGEDKVFSHDFPSGSVP